MMVNFKTAIKVSIISAALIAGSVTPTVQADHDSHSILPYVAIGIFASILNSRSHSHEYRYKRKRHYGHSGHGYSAYGHGGGHYTPHHRHNHSQGGYHYKRKKH